MQYGSLRLKYIRDKIIEEYGMSADKDINICDYPESIKLLHEEYPTLSDDDLLKMILMILSDDNTSSEEKITLVATTPASFAFNVRQTEWVVSEMISSAQSSIIMTGYSISDFVDDYLNQIISKSQRGIYVKLFINNIEKQDHIDRLLRYQSKFLRIFNYQNVEDKMSALHAKVISVDGLYTLISSANLSYHGMSGNIELGSKIESSKIAKQMNDLFSKLIQQKIFVELK